MITIKNVDFSYKGKTALFKDLSLNFPSGRITGLVAKNGEGKTTLLKLICGLLTRGAGEASINDFDPQKGEVALLEDLFFVPEEFEFPGFFTSASSFAKAYSVFYPKFSNEEFEKLCQDFEIKLSHKASKMSMGQKRKLMLAFALACNTRVLILDEPFNALDVPSKEVLKKAMISRFDESKNFILSSHQIREMENLVDSICIMKDSQLVLNAGLEQVAEKFSFVLGGIAEGENNINEGEEIIFSKDTAYGNVSVVENTSGKETVVDLELLFAAVLARPEKFTNLKF